MTAIGNLVRQATYGDLYSRNAERPLLTRICKYLSVGRHETRLEKQPKEIEYMYKDMEKKKRLRIVKCKCRRSDSKGGYLNFIVRLCLLVTFVEYRFT